MTTYRAVIDRAEQRLQDALSRLERAVVSGFQILCGFAILGAAALVVIAVLLWAWRTVFA